MFPKSIISESLNKQFKPICEVKSQNFRNLIQTNYENLKIARQTLDYK